MTTTKTVSASPFPLYCRYILLAETFSQYLFSLGPTIINKVECKLEPVTRYTSFRKHGLRTIRIFIVHERPARMKEFKRAMLFFLRMKKITKEIHSLWIRHQRALFLLLTGCSLRSISASVMMAAECMDTTDLS